MYGGYIFYLVFWQIAVANAPYNPDTRAVHNIYRYKCANVRRRGQTVIITAVGNICDQDFDNCARIKHVYKILVFFLKFNTIYGGKKRHCVYVAFVL